MCIYYSFLNPDIKFIELSSLVMLLTLPVNVLAGVPIFPSLEFGVLVLKF